MCGYDVFKGVSMSLRLKCVFIGQNVSRKTECVLLLNAVSKLRHVRLHNIACFFVALTQFLWLDTNLDTFVV